MPAPIRFSLARDGYSTVSLSVTADGETWTAELQHWMDAPLARLATFMRAMRAGAAFALDPFRPVSLRTLPMNGALRIELSGAWRSSGGDWLGGGVAFVADADGSHDALRDAMRAFAASVDTADDDWRSRFAWDAFLAAIEG